MNNTNGNNMNNMQVSDDRLVIPQNVENNGGTYLNNNEANTQLNIPNQVAPVDYSKDSTVQQNLQKKKNNSISISSDGLVFIVIAIILLVFIFFLPTVYDFLNS